MDKAFESQMGRNIEVYIDDLVVNSHTEAEMVRDIEETFQTQRKINMKLNPKKCSFGLAKGVFLGGKIPAAVLDTKKCVKKSDFRWTAEAERAFKQLKQHLSDLPLLVTPKPQEKLIMYLSATHGAITKRFRRYFQAHPITVITDQPINQVMSRPDVAGRLQKWSIMLGEHNITYRPRTSIKGQILADFLNEIPDKASQVNYLKEGILPGDEKEARKLRLKARQYKLIEGVLYKRSFLTPWLRCVGPLQAEYVMREIHEGSCSMHAGPRSVVAKAIRLGYFWPTMHKDARDMIRIKARLGEGNKNWVEELPHSNGLVERANRSLGEGIKARLGEGNKNWVEELPHVLWAHRTMIKSSHDDTPFSLTYGTKAVIPTEIGMPTYRTTAVDVVNNDEELRLNLDLLEERRELAAMSEAKSKSKMMKYHNSRVRGVAFKPGDFVYRSNNASHAVVGSKLGPK
nr:reverse transcriptase domain-containing protein [Tanacetum cinerariifolium]